MRRFSHLKEFRRGDVEDLREDLILIAEEARTDDETRREGVHPDVARLVVRAETTVQFPREKNVAQFRVLVRLVGVERAPVDHVEPTGPIRDRPLEPRQVTQRRGFALRPPGTVGIVHARRGNDDPTAVRVDRVILQQEAIKVEVTKVIRANRQFVSLRRPRHVLGVDVARQSRIVAHRIERVIFVTQIPHEGVDGGEVGEVALHRGQFDRFEEG